MSERTDDKRWQRAWAQFYSTRRLELFERAVNDPDLTSLRCELAKLDLRIHELQELQGEGKTREAWSEVQHHADELWALVKPRDDGKIPVLDLDRLRPHVEAIVNRTQGPAPDDELWDALLPLIKLRRSLAVAERQREELYNLLIPAAALTLMFDDLHRAIETVIDDRAMQLLLLRELVKTFDGGKRVSTPLQPLNLPAPFLSAVESISAVEIDVDQHPDDESLSEGTPTSESVPDPRPPVES